MQFLCDVHISYKVVRHLRTLGFETTHVNEILDKWHTKDSDICAYADENDFIIITKDADFKNSFLIRGTPNKLVKVNLGNISTSALISVISENLPAIQRLYLSKKFMVELDQNSAVFVRAKE